MYRVRFYSKISTTVYETLEEAQRKSDTISEMFGEGTTEVIKLLDKQQITAKN